MPKIYPSPVIEADTLPADSMCATKVFLATVLASKNKGNRPAEFEPRSCQVAINDDDSDLINPIFLNRGVVVIEDGTQAILSGLHDTIMLQVLGGCP